MAVLDLRRKLAILADAAKYDASCASSGPSRRDSRGGKGVGSTGPAWASATPMRRTGAASRLLKILLTNFCIYDCAYCVNRVSSNIPRARFTVEEVVDLTLGFYKRNYIEGLFLSSGIIRDGDYTMEEMVRVARTLREIHDFRGYIHLKLIPEAQPGPGRRRRRSTPTGVSINIELPRDDSLDAWRRRRTPAAHQAGHGRGAARHRGAVARRARKAEAAALRPGRPVDPDDRRRRRRHATARSWRAARRSTAATAAAGLLFRLQPDPGLHRPPAAGSGRR